MKNFFDIFILIIKQIMESDFTIKFYIPFRVTAKS